MNSTSPAGVVSGEAPTEFVPARWRAHVDSAKGESERGAAERHAWEIAVLYGLHAALRSGDVWVPGSRRYADPSTYLISKDTWPGLRSDFCQLTGMPSDPHTRLTQPDSELRADLDALEPILARGDGIARLDAEGELVVSPLPAEALPAETSSLRYSVEQRLPRVDLASLLIEVDALCGFTSHLTHAGGATSRSKDLRRNLYAALLAEATNLGYARNGRAAGISEDALAWTTQWYFREETLRAANTALVNFHHRLPLARLWGGGTLSSSDGQRFPQRGKSTTARALSRYFLDEGTTTYTHVADRHATRTGVFLPPSGTHLRLDEILGNPTDLPLTEHATDTAGQTFAVFAACDLLGLRFSPRIRGPAQPPSLPSRPQPNSSRPGPTPVDCSPSPSRPG